MTNLIISAVPISLLDHLYPKSVDCLKKAADKAPNDIFMDEVKENLYSGRTMLVIVSDGAEVIAANILEKVTFGTGHSVLFIPITGGERIDEWMDRFLNIAHAIARDLNCVELRGIACRKGWLRKLKEQDWYPLHEVIGCKVKQITEG